MQHNYEYQQHLREQAIASIRIKARRHRLILLLPVHIVAYMTGSILLLAHYWGNGFFVDLFKIGLLVWTILFAVHILVVFIKLIWEFIVWREIRRLRRAETKARPTVTWRRPEKAKHTTRLSSDGEIAEAEDIAYDDRFSEDFAYEEPMTRGNHYN